MQQLFCVSYREKCLAEKGERCDYCNSEGEIHVHHLDGDRSNNSLSNLVPLCNTCHKRSHAGRDDYQEYWEDLPSRMIAENSADDHKTTISIDGATKDILNKHRTENETWSVFLLRLVEGEVTAETTSESDIDEVFEQRKEEHEQLMQKLDRIPDRIVAELR